MRQRSLWLPLIGVLATLALAGSAAAMATTWSNAIEVPGTATLNSGADAKVYSVSCAAAGQCAAGGYYKDGSGGSQAFVVSEKRGHWGKAIEVPGTAALNTGASSKVSVVSCGAPGDCAAGGYYKQGSGHFQAFLVTEKRGRWGKAVRVPGTATLNAGGSGFLNAISCAAAGECAAGGTYRDASAHDQAFLVTEKRGRWGKAVEVPGTAALNIGDGSAGLFAVSCSAVGECAASGQYTDGSGHNQAFFVSEKHGRWGKAAPIPGLPLLNVGGVASVKSVSCAAVGECSAGGFYKDGSGHLQPFVVNEKRSHWGKAVQVPGTATLNVGAHALLTTVSCRAAGECAAGGYYADGSGAYQAFVADEKHGSWGAAIEVPGTAALNTDGNAVVNSVSCVGVGRCVAGGYYAGGSTYQPFLVSETHGQWGNATDVPGSLNAGGDGLVYSVSCVATGACAAGGSYEDAAAKPQAFVVSGKP
jgi:hypothetical protein